MKSPPKVGRLQAESFDKLQNGIELWPSIVIALALAIARHVTRYVLRRLTGGGVAAEPARTMKITVGGMDRCLEFYGSGRISGS